MINKQRVRRIKNLIYAFIIIVLFLPLILMSILSFYMINLTKKMDGKLDELNKTTLSQQGVEPSPSDGGYVIEPETQSTNDENPDLKHMEEKKSDSVGEQAPDASGQLPDTTGTSPLGIASNDKTVDGNTGLNGGNFPLIGSTSDKNGTPSGGPGSDAVSGTIPQNGGNLLGGGDHIQSSGNTAGASGGGSVNNPSTGNGGTISEGGNGNPLTGR